MPRGVTILGLARTLGLDPSDLLLKVRRLGTPVDSVDAEIPPQSLTPARLGRGRGRRRVVFWLWILGVLLLTAWLLIAFPP